MNDTKDYLVCVYGDLNEVPVGGFETLEEALLYIKKTYSGEEGAYVDAFGETIGTMTPDPEDDRILVWERLPTGHHKVVWHFSGWHWDPDCMDQPPHYPLPQGTLPGHSKPLYALAEAY